MRRSASSVTEMLYSKAMALSRRSWPSYSTRSVKDAEPRRRSMSSGKRRISMFRVPCPKKTSESAS